MTTIRGIIFDKDGTLFDFVSTWESWAQAFLRRISRDQAHAKDMGAAIGFDTKTATFAPHSIVIAGTPGEVADVLLKHLDGWSKRELLSVLNEEAAIAPQQQAVPLHPFLTGLRAAGYQLGVATNDAEAPARAPLNVSGVEHLFDFIAGFDSGFGAKPQAGQLNAFCAHTGLGPEQVMMVGDSTHDLIAGRNAGMLCVGVLTGLASRGTLEPHADFVLDNIGHLPAALKK